MAIDKNEFNSLVKLLEKYGIETTNEMKTRLKSQGKIASGTLFDSIDWKVMTFKNGPTLSILAADYATYVDKGRPPGKQPPLKKIKAWCTIKGIPQSAAYPIARKIGLYGIPATNFLTIPFNRRMQQLDKDIENVMSIEVQAKLKAFAEKIKNK